jgi:hypothetical protein
MHIAVINYVQTVKFKIKIKKMLTLLYQYIYFPCINAFMSVILLWSGGDSMPNTNLVPHEAIEVRELISQEMLDIKKVRAYTLTTLIFYLCT